MFQSMTECIYDAGSIRLHGLMTLNNFGFYILLPNFQTMTKFVSLILLEVIIFLWVTWMYYNTYRSSCLFIKITMHYYHKVLFSFLYNCMGYHIFFNQITELIGFGLGIILSYHLLLILLKFMTVYTFNGWDTCFN